MKDDRVNGNLLKENDNKQKVVIYQMMTRLFGNKKQLNHPYGTLEENGAGKFDDIDHTALGSLSDMGITHIWYTGIIEHAVLTDYRKYGIFSDDAAVVKGRAGSPYAIKDYYDVDPDLANDVNNRMAEFDQLVTRTHDHGLKVLIDFVPNHVARRYYSDQKPTDVEDLGAADDTTVGFHPSNNFYYLPGEAFRAPDGYAPLGSEHTHSTGDTAFEEFPAKFSGNNVFKSQPDINDWFETVKLNYGVDYTDQEKEYFDPIPPTWVKMRDILLFWTHKGVDGFRCDMAEMVPVEFWEWVIPQVREINPEVLFIAEIYHPAQNNTYLYKGKFDFLYDKVQLYDTLKQIIQGQSTTTRITQVWKDLDGINHKMLRFLENHDEQRVASPYFAGDPFRALPAMTVSAILSSGPVMIYFGQETGEKGEGYSGFSRDDGRTTIYDYWGVPAHQRWMNNGAFDGGQLSDGEKELRSFYSKLLQISKDNSAITSGNFFDLYNYNRQIGNTLPEDTYSFLRFDEDQVLLIAVNFNHSRPYSVDMIIPHSIEKYPILSPSNKVILTDMISGRKETVTTAGRYGKIITRLDPLASLIFEVNQ